LALARREPAREVVFFAIGFETTAPANAMAAYQAKAGGVKNFSLLVSQVLVGPAMDFILRSPGSQVQGFLAAGHAAAVTGVAELKQLSLCHQVPVVVTGFEPVDLLDGILRCVRQLEEGRAELENAYARAVRPEGNAPALAMTHRVFEVIDREWRGLGVLPASGLGLRADYTDFDAARRFNLGPAPNGGDEECQGGRVMLGTLRPDQCPAFGNRCRPEHPLGAPMVSSEGACAAYFRFRSPPAATH
jgi:hydrogenase expression/formation protein HypD